MGFELLRPFRVTPGAQSAQVTRTCRKVFLYLKTIGFESRFDSESGRARELCKGWARE